jgi:hypothetical protein
VAVEEIMPTTVAKNEEEKRTTYFRPFVWL